jgi:hypothetical protein
MDTSVAAGLLVAGPLLGILGFYDTKLWRVWMLPRDEHLALVDDHRRGWTMVNVGFTVATVLSAAGLLLLAASAAVQDGSRAVLAAGAVAYSIGGVLWCVVLGIRARTTPALARMAATGTPTEPAETLLGAALGGLFAGFALVTSLALVAIGVALAIGGGVVAPIAWLVALVGALITAWFLAAGDIIPAVLYVPTLLVGLALLAGWT